MARKYSIVNKRQWLEDFEKGYSEAYIASKYHCDLRTLKNGLEDARHEREARAAVVEVLKNALMDHQEQLKKKLREIIIQTQLVKLMDISDCRNTKRQKLNIILL